MFRCTSLSEALRSASYAQEKLASTSGRPTVPESIARLSSGATSGWAGPWKIEETIRVERRHLPLAPLTRPALIADLYDLHGSNRTEIESAETIDMVYPFQTIFTFAEMLQIPITYLFGEILILPLT